MKTQMQLLLSDVRGIYIPRDFSEFNMEKWHVSEERAGIISDPDHEWYWEAWNEVLNSAYFIDDAGEKWYLYQDGDLWAVPEDYVWEEDEI